MSQFHSSEERWWPGREVYCTLVMCCFTGALRSVNLQMGAAVQQRKASWAQLVPSFSRAEAAELALDAFSAPTHAAAARRGEIEGGQWPDSIRHTPQPTLLHHTPHHDALSTLPQRVDAQPAHSSSTVCACFSDSHSSHRGDEEATGCTRAQPQCVTATSSLSTQQCAVLH